MPFNTGGAVGESGDPTSSLPSVDHSFVSINRDDENLLEGRAGEKPVVVQEIPTKRISGNSVFLEAIIVMIDLVASSAGETTIDDGGTMSSIGTMRMRHAR